MRAKMATLSALGISFLMLALIVTLTVSAQGPPSAEQSAGTDPGLPAVRAWVTPHGAGEWTPLGGPATDGGQVNALAVHPTIAGTVYAAVAPLNAYDSGPSTIYKTTDSASSWAPVYIAEHQVYALTVAGTNVYAGAFNPGGVGPSIYASDDSGGTWAPMFSFNGRGVWLDIAADSTDPDIAMAGGWVRPEGEGWDQGVVYGTDDGGVNWTPALTVSVAGEDSAVNAVLIHPLTPNLWLAAARVGNSSDSVIYRSVDGGATWPASFTIPGAHAMSFVAHASNPQILYAGTGSNEQGGTWGPSKVFRSSDAGLIWVEVTSDAGGLVAFEPPSTVYAGVDPLWASTSNGDPGTWALLEDWWAGPQLSFDIDLGYTPATLYAGGGWSGVAKSINGGTEWTGANNGIETPVTPVDIAVDPQNLDKLFVAAECQAGWMTADGGLSWMTPDGVSDCMMSFAVSPQDSDVVYAGAMSPTTGAVRRSEDGGLTFTPVYTASYILPDGSGGQQTIPALAIAPSMPDTVYAAGSDHPDWQDGSAVIVRSLDDGVSWSEVFTLPARSSVEVLAINPVDDDVVYAGGEDCHSGPCEGLVYRTSDGGDTWTQVYTGQYRVTSIVVDYWNPEVLYLADRDYDVYKSVDGGDTRTLIRCNEPPFNAPSGWLLAIDPHVPSHVYLGGWGYIAETTDGGATWSEWGDPINQGTPEREPSALAVDYGADTQTLYAGFTGVWAHSRLAPQPSRVYLPVVMRNY